MNENESNVKNIRLIFYINLIDSIIMYKENYLSYNQNYRLHHILYRLNLE